MTMIKQYSAEAMSALAAAVMEGGKEGYKFNLKLVEQAREDPDGGKNGPQFVEFIEKEMKRISKNRNIIIGEKEPDLAGERKDEMIRICCSDFIGTEPDVILRLSSWVESFLTPADACRPGVWGYLNTYLLQRNIVSPFWFAYRSSSKVREPARNCSSEIDLAIKWVRKKEEEKKRVEEKKEQREQAGEKKEQSKLEDVARRIVRQFCGAQEIRGRRTMYQNVSLARAYWIKQVAERTAESIGNSQTVENIVKTISPPIWPELSERMVSSQTVIGDQNILSGLIMHLLASENIQDKKIRSKLQKIGIMCSWRALGIFPPANVKEIIEKEIFAQPEKTS